MHCKLYVAAFIIYVLLWQSVCALHSFGVVALNLFLCGSWSECASCAFVHQCSLYLLLRWCLLCVLRTLSSYQEWLVALSQSHPGAVLAAVRSIASSNAE